MNNEQLGGTMNNEQLTMNNGKKKSVLMEKSD
jgi:hypothetical protein